MSATPDVNDARIAVLEAGYVELSTDVGEIRADIKEMRNDLANRPTPELAKSMARMQAFAAACGTGLVSALLFIAVNF